MTEYTASVRITNMCVEALIKTVRDYIESEAEKWSKKVTQGPI